MTDPYAIQPVRPPLPPGARAPIPEQYAIRPSGPGSAPAQPRPPLSRREVRGAIIAGAVAYSVAGLGFALFAIPIALGVVLSIVRGIAGVARNTFADDRRLREFAEGVLTYDIGPWIGLLVIASLVGAALWVGAILTSRAILRAHGIARPWAVTWSGLGIAVLVSSVVGGTASGFSGFGGSDDDRIGAIVTVLAVLGALVTIVVNAAVGGAAWWAMAVAFRPRAESRPGAADRSWKEAETDRSRPHAETDQRPE